MIAFYSHQLSLVALMLLVAASLQTAFAQTQSTNITRLSSLNTTALGGINRSKWLSPSGELAFGFYSINESHFLVGIWFDKIKQKTLIWSANRNNPLTIGASLELAVDGRLVIRDPQGNPQIIVNSQPASSGSMQDDGNFVLKNSKSGVAWQSFDFPTNTLLPGQYLLRGQSLLSNVNDTAPDYSTGRYQMSMQLDGMLVLSATKYTEGGYWNKDLTDGDLYFNETTKLMYAFNKTTRVSYSNFTDPASLGSPLEDYYHRAMLDDHGNFKQYTYPKVNGQEWTVVYFFIYDGCFASAVCGEYGICVPDQNQTMHCSCPPGYSVLDPDNPFNGCFAETMADVCGLKPSGYNFSLIKLSDTDFPNDFRAERQRFNSSEEDCISTLMDDCFSIAAVFSDGMCHTKRMPLLNGRTGELVTGLTTYIKVANMSVAHANGGKNHGLRVGLITLTCALLAFLAFLSLYFHHISRRQYQKLNSANMVEMNLQEFTFHELQVATKGFTSILGRGAHGIVYGGLIRCSNHEEATEIAVKRIDMVMDQGEKEFKTELQVIARAHHKNLVQLLGFCDDGKNRLLVYELMKNGSLSQYLFKQEQKPTWSRRFEIALGIARGLLYLHEECESQIIHCDIKPQNILLDDSHTAKITDFGLAKALKKDHSRTSTNIRGTMGYLAPEWLKNRAITSKVDVYSYGVMLLEIICCRRHIEVERVEEESEDENLHIIDWVMSCMREGKLENLVEWDEEALTDFSRFDKCAKVGLWCISHDVTLRPTMKEVVQILEDAMEVETPPLHALAPETPNREPHHAVCSVYLQSSTMS